MYYAQCLYTGLLSKSRGLVLRVATVLHLLFYVHKEGEEIPDAISTEALSAAIDFVHVTCQQTAYMVGRGKIEEEVQKFQNGLLIFSYRRSGNFRRHKITSDKN
jgi:hypothetical protein